jgi:maltose-binding protein MalE
MAASERAIASPKQLIIWHNQDKEQAAIFRHVIGEFERKEKVQVALETGMDLSTSLLVQRRSQHFPDAVLGPSDLVGLHDTIELSPVPSQLTPKDMDPKAVETVTVDGRIWGVPVLSGNHLLLFYHKQHVPKVASTWDELAAQARVLTQRKLGTLALDRSDPYVFLTFALSLGSWPMPGSRPLFDRLSMPQSLRTYRTMLQQVGAIERCDSACVIQEFSSGRFAYAINGDWAILPIFRRIAGGFGVAALPKTAKGPMQSTRGSHALMFPARSLSGPKSKILMRLALHLVSAKSQQAFMQGFNGPVLRTVDASLSPSKDIMQASLEQLQKSHPMPNSPYVFALWRGLSAGLGLAFDQQVSDETAVRRMQEASDNLIENLQRERSQPKK